MKRATAVVGLDNIMVSSPCSMSWGSMSGDERVRACSGCNKNVYNLSDMTKREAESFLAQHGVSQCLRFYRRKDGTIMTDDCPVGLRGLRNRYRSFWKCVAGLYALIVGQSHLTVLAQDALPIQSVGDANMGGATCQSTEVIPLCPPSKVVPAKAYAYSYAKITKPGTAKRTDASIDKITNSVRNVVKLRASKAQVAPSAVTATADKSAQNLFEKGLECEAEGKLFVAATYYKSAQAAVTANKKSDPKFRSYILQRLHNIEEQIGIGPQ